MTSDPWRAEDGNTLLLMPAAVLILLLLAAITVDAAVVFLGERRLSDLAAGIANDAASAVDIAHFQATGDVRLDPDGARAAAGTSVAAFDRDNLQSVACDVQVVADEVTVVCVGDASPIFGGIVPGAGAAWGIESTAVARAESG